MNKLTIVAKILAKDKSRALVKKELIQLIDITRKEKGCIIYELHQDNSNPNLFLFFEKWESRELWRVHVENLHIARYKKNTEGAIEESSLYEMTEIG